MNWLKNRLKERSTWSGIIALAAIAGVTLSPEQKEMIISVGSTLVALIFTFTADKAAPPVETADPLLREAVHYQQRIVTPDISGENGFAEWPTVVLLLALAVPLLMFSGCATLQKDPPMATTGKALLTVKSTIVASAVTVDRLCQTKTLSVDTCRQARDAYATAKTAYDAAVDSYLLVQGGGGDPAALAATMQRLESLAVNLATLAGGAK